MTEAQFAALKKGDRVTVNWDSHTRRDGIVQGHNKQADRVIVDCPDGSGGWFLAYELDLPDTETPDLFGVTP